MQHHILTALPPTQIWKGKDHRTKTQPHVPSGFDALDERIGGWPLGHLIEISPEQTGIGEISVLLPALAQLSRGTQRLLFVNPPYIPYAPSLFSKGVNISNILVVQTDKLTEIVWAIEQASRSKSCSAIICWHTEANDQAIRRYQLALENQKILGVLFTKPALRKKNNPAPWRVIVREAQSQTWIDIPKRRGGGPISSIPLAHLNH